MSGDWPKVINEVDQHFHHFLPRDVCLLTSTSIAIFNYFIFHPLNL